MSKPSISVSHTPGPWEVHERGESMVKTVISEKVSVEDFPYEIFMPSPPFALGACGALVARKGGLPHEGDAFATACVIGAAPEMLEALKAADRILFLLSDEINRLGFNARKIPGMVKAAIAKAGAQ